jgi:hypothetical protein|uniref:Uncharacterized protein n=1 Tax=Enterococcus faecium TaxID=1352 RepID=A0A8F5V6V0_ENTFC|nr:hypothetical protein Tn6711_000100 [Enterococcus faecium]
MAEVLENPFLVLLEIVVVEPARPAVVKIQGDEGGGKGGPLHMLGVLQTSCPL